MTNIYSVTFKDVPGVAELAGKSEEAVIKFCKKRYPAKLKTIELARVSKSKKEK